MTELCIFKNIFLNIASTDDSREQSIFTFLNNDKGRSLSVGDLTPYSKPRFAIVGQTAKLLPASIIIVLL